MNQEKMGPPMPDKMAKEAITDGLKEYELRKNEARATKWEINEKKLAEVLDELADKMRSEGKVLAIRFGTGFDEYTLDYFRKMANSKDIDFEEQEMWKEDLAGIEKQGNLAIHQAIFLPLDEAEKFVKMHGRNSIKGFADYPEIIKPEEVHDGRIKELILNKDGHSHLEEITGLSFFEEKK